jgi:hypothetical protein
MFFEHDSIAQCIRRLELLVLGSSQGACHPLWSQMLSHIVVKGSRLSKFVACTRSVKAQHSEQFSGLESSKRQVYLSTVEINQENQIDDVMSIRKSKVAQRLAEQRPEIKVDKD